MELEQILPVQRIPDSGIEEDFAKDFTRLRSNACHCLDLQNDSQRILSARLLMCFRRFFHGLDDLDQAQPELIIKIAEVLKCVSVGEFSDSATVKVELKSAKEKFFK